MDKSRQVALMLGLDGHHEAAVPLGDDGLLQNLGIGGRGDDALQDLPALGLGLAHVTADIRQLAACRVGNDPLLGDAAADLLLQKAVALEGEEKVVDGGALLGLVIEILSGPAGGVEQTADGDELAGIQAAATVSAAERLRHGLDSGEGRCAVKADHHPGGVGLIQQALHLFPLGLRTQAQGPLLCLGRDCLLSQQFQHPGQFQGADGFFK